MLPTVEFRIERGERKERWREGNTVHPHCPRGGTASELVVGCGRGLDRRDGGGVRVRCRCRLGGSRRILRLFRRPALSIGARLIWRTSRGRATQPGLLLDVTACGRGRTLACPRGI